MPSDSNKAGDGHAYPGPVAEVAQGTRMATSTPHHCEICEEKHAATGGGT